VLVEPREAGNVGAAARVMKNFGFGELWIAGEHPPLDPLAGWWASGADDVVRGAAFAPSLREAIATAHVTVATTSLRGRATAARFAPAELAALFATLRAGQTLALVFGREDSGLTREEVALCQHTAAIPTNAAFPTMNLAQAVGVFCFTLSQVKPAPSGRELPEAGLVELLHERARKLLLEVGFLHENNPDRIYDELRAIVARADLDQREATILAGIIRQIEWALRAGRGSC
jgi:tRNA/rRNA methyltransferase